MLGGEQSGHIEAIGFEMYTTMLEEAVRTMKGDGDGPAHGTTVINLGISVRIDDSYIPEENQRLRMYKRIAGAADYAALSDVRAELEDRYGKPPESVLNLLAAGEIRLHCEQLGIADARAQADGSRRAAGREAEHERASAGSARAAETRADRPACAARATLAAQLQRGLAATGHERNPGGAGDRGSEARQRTPGARRKRSKRCAMCCTSSSSTGAQMRASPTPEGAGAGWVWPRAADEAGQPQREKRRAVYAGGRPALAPEFRKGGRCSCRDPRASGFARWRTRGDRLSARLQ